MNSFQSLVIESYRHQIAYDSRLLGATPNTHVNTQGDETYTLAAVLTMRFWTLYIMVQCLTSEGLVIANGDRKEHVLYRLTYVKG